ncbi:MFS family permease [Rhodococcus erythropolis]|uniref:MFS transporter n=1 Tax=Rhodococcus erythropolis TaxID=1833 RepID=UPI00216A75F2|nr:MFS transporter [Rhodococcus erythropolis]MCS4255739.1 MFS family permease [Rhodococcus erythropolis]MCW2425253.1 MFS family permease [Rhodococcus erythropolis]
MSQASTAEVTDGKKVRKIAAASMAGTALEYYDFSIYGLAAALVFPSLFFPESSAFVGILASFGTLAIGYFARPVGAIVFGHFGDKIGRKPVLVITLVIMGVASTLIGLLPTYASVGAWAAVALVGLRLVQGIAFGGEWGGAILMAFEYAKPERRGFFASIPQVGPAVGTLLGNAVFLSVTLLPDEDFNTWGWRVPFVLSAVLVALGLVVRLKIAESPEFAVVKQEGTEVKVPIVVVLKDHLKPVLLVCGGFLGYGAFSIIALTYLVGYARNEQGVSSSVTLTAILATCVVQIPVIMLGGHFSDKYGRRLIMTIGPLAAIVAVFALFWSVNTGNPWWIVTGYILGMGVLFTSAYGAQPALFADSFQPSIRYTGMSLGYQMSNVIGSGLMPLVATLLLRGTGTSYSIAVAIALTLVISMVCLLKLVRISTGLHVSPDSVSPVASGELAR